MSKVTNKMNLNDMGVSTIGEFKDALRNAGTENKPATTAEVNAIIDTLVGYSDSDAISRHLLPEGQTEVTPKEIGKFRSRRATLVMRIVTGMFTDIRDELNITRNHGGGGGRPKLVKTMVAEAAKDAKAQARQDLGLQIVGKISAETQPEYEKAVTAHFKSALTELRKEHGAEIREIGNTQELVTEFLGFGETSEIQPASEMPSETETETEPATV